MNTTTKLSASALIVAALSALSMQAQAGDQATYQRVVLGQSTLSQPAAEQSETALKLVPGSYARYLMVVNGTPQAQALQQARSIGEQPSWQASLPARDVALTGFERYERAMGRPVVQNATVEAQNAD